MGHDDRMPPIPLIIDTDGGVDDAVALWWAVTDPRLDVLAITVVWGNVSVDVATNSVLRVLAAWEDVARKTQAHGVEAHRRMLAHVQHALATGEAPPGSRTWEELKADRG